MDAIWSFLAEYKFYVFISVLLVISILLWRFIDKIQHVSYGEFKIDRKVD
ncbi:hypothetical protein [Neisseria yangbaofengii]|nr:hypothetical protein [Neisseria yangbaofengii]